MTSNGDAPAPLWNKFHSSQPAQQYTPVKTCLPRRPVTSPTLPTPPVPPKGADVTGERIKGPCMASRNPGAEHRWSEVVPPATALTFAAIWDPEEGLVTFSGASLSASENDRSNVSPDDAEACSQVLAVDFLNMGTPPSTAKDSLLYPYSQSRFAASEISTQRFPVSPTRRSSAGTGLALDAVVRPELEKKIKVPSLYGRNPGARNPHAPSLKSGKPTPTRISHQHSSSQDSGVTNGLSALGSGLYNAFRRVASPKPAHSRSERYAFLRRAAGQADDSFMEFDEQDEKMQIRVDDPGINTPPKSAGLRSIFSRSVWLRGGIGGGRNEGLVYRSQNQDDCDGISLDSGFDCIDIDDGSDETWHVEGGGGREALDAALSRDVNRLKSTFSWTTTSTSRYIDVAAFLEMDSDTDSTVSSLGAPIPSTVSPFHSQLANSFSDHAQEGNCDSPWFPVEPPTPRVGLPVPQQPKPHRNLLRKPSKAQVACSSTAKAPCKPTVAPMGQGHKLCPQCHLRIECADLEAKENGAISKKGKERADSQPGSPDSIRSTVSLGRPAAVRSSSSPASLPFPHSRSYSLPCSRAATPAEVLSRASYNHEWASPIPSRPISHVRSPSAPQPGSPMSTMSMRRSTTPTRTCQHITDVRDVLRGVRSGLRPSTPIPGMPPTPPKNRPPPTSFRPVSAGGRERGRSGTPTSSAAHSQGHFSHVAPSTRSQSHRASAENISGSRFRTRSLESLRGTAQALASASTAPIRSLWRARSFIRNSLSDQPRRSDVDGDEDGVWIRVDIKTPDNKAEMSAYLEGQSSDDGPSGIGNATHSPC